MDSIFVPRDDAWKRQGIVITEEELGSQVHEMLMLAISEHHEAQRQQSLRDSVIDADDEWEKGSTKVVVNTLRHSLSPVNATRMYRAKLGRLIDRIPRPRSLRMAN